jgi:hypothetical protein
MLTAIAVVIAGAGLLVGSGGSSRASVKTVHQHGRTATVTPFKRVPPGVPSGYRC